MATLLDSNKFDCPNYDFEILDNLILEQLNPEHSGFCISSENLDYWNDISLSQKEFIRKRILSNSFNFLDENRAKTYIQNHQAHITSLINSISGYILSEALKSEPECVIILEKIRDSLESLLNFLTIRYKNYFDFNANATITHKQFITGSLHEKLDFILSIATAQKSELFSIALKPIWDFLGNGLSSPVSYRTLRYYEALLQEISILSKNDKPFDKALKFSLICFNYNSFRFFAYLTSEIKSELDSRTSYSTKIELLSRFLKKYNQILEYPEFVLNPKQISIKQQITGWIIEEIEHLERSQKSTFSNAQRVSNSLSTDFKLQTDLSVAQLGYFIKVLFDTGIIKNKNHREVIRFFAHQFKTKQTDAISWESLRSRFYNVEEGTRDSIREVAINMLNQINKKD